MDHAIYEDGDNMTIIGIEYILHTSYNLYLTNFQTV